MTVAAARPAGLTLADEHDVLLWQTCSYADDLIEAVESGQPAADAHDAMLEFAHYRLLPYLSHEERELPANELRDDHLAQLLLDDHARIRHGVHSIEAGRTRQLLALAADELVERLARHIRREQAWLIRDVAAPADPATSASWALPLVLADEIDVDALPAEVREDLVVQANPTPPRRGQAAHPYGGPVGGHLLDAAVVPELVEGPAQGGVDEPVGGRRRCERRPDQVGQQGGDADSRGVGVRSRQVG